MLPRNVTSATSPGTRPEPSAADAGTRRRLSGRIATCTLWPATIPGGRAALIGCTPPTVTIPSSSPARTTWPEIRFTSPMKSATILLTGRAYTALGHVLDADPRHQPLRESRTYSPTAV